MGACSGAGLVPAARTVRNNAHTDNSTTAKTGPGVPGPTGTGGTMSAHAGCLRCCRADCRFRSAGSGPVHSIGVPAQGSNSGT